MPDLALSRRTGLGMITLRLDLAAAGAAGALAAATGLPLPERRRIAVAAAGPEAGLAAWMSPDELLLVGPAGATAERLAGLGAALADRSHLAVDVSDARAVFRLDGPAARATLARGAPVDLAPASFRPGDLRRTRLGTVAAAFWANAGDSFDLVCFRSVADYVGLWLETSARSA